MGVSQNEAAGTGSLSQGSVSRVCFVVCFGGLFRGLFRTVLLPRTVKFKGSVSGSVSKVCFGVCFGGLFRQSRTSQPYLKLHSPKKCKPKSTKICGSGRSNGTPKPWSIWSQRSPFGEPKKLKYTQQHQTCPFLSAEKIHKGICYTVYTDMEQWKQKHMGNTWYGDANPWRSSVFS